MEGGSVGDNSDEEREELSTVTFSDLTWEDILFIHVLPTLSWEDLFNLRSVSRSCMKMIDAYWAQMKCLDFSDVHADFSITAFQAVTYNCKSLRHLLVPDARWIRDAELSRVFRANKQMVYIDLSGCADLNGCPWVWRGAIDTLIAHLKKLQEVDLSSCASLCSKQITQFTQAFPRLTRFQIGRLPSVNDSTVVTVARNCRHLKYFDIRACMNVTDQGIRAISEYCKHLEVLKVANCHLVTEYSLSVLRQRNITIDRPVPPDFVSLPFFPAQPPLMQV